MKKRLVFAMTVLAGLMMAASWEAAAQVDPDWSQSSACPGWNNPNSFTSGSGVNKYSGAGIYVNGTYCSGSSSSGCKPCPNPLTGATGATTIGPNYTASQLGSVVSSGSCTNLPGPTNQYKIMTDLTGTDPNTGGHLKYVPTQFNTHDTTPGAINTNLTKSIRIGDGCYWSGANSSNGGSGAVLNYTMRVTENNAMMYIYYCIVAEAPGHGQQGNPTFIIRIMKKNSVGNWVQISDTLAYYISATPSSDVQHACTNMSYVTMAQAGQSGWHQQGSGYNQVFYKDWEKVCMNLSNYLYDTLQVQVMIYDCLYNAHYAYGYIAGECRPMAIQTTGCPAGMSTDVTTLSAPQHLRNYVWYASEWGAAQSDYGFEPGGENGHFTWRQLTPNTSTNYIYRPQASDFAVTRRFGPNGTPITIPDSIGKRQTFRCKMTSAIDPAKPFDSYLYVSVNNTKPTMAVDSVFMCNGTARMRNLSYVPGEPALVVNDSTRWRFYNNPYCEGTYELELRGDSVTTSFDNVDLKGVRVTTYTTDPTCYSEAIYPIKPRQNPRVDSIKIVPPSRVLCDAAPATLTDVSNDLASGRYLWREWSFRDPSAAEQDMTLSVKVRGTGEENRSVTRSFTHGLEPVELLVRNGTYYFEPTAAHDTIWCQTLVRDTISVFQHPELEVTGPTVVCEGSTTNATVRALGVDGCTYQWSTKLNEIRGDLPAGPTLQVVPYADTATYYVRVTSPQGCVAWDSLYCYVVRPKVTIEPSDGRICPGDVAVLKGADAFSYTWSASPADASLAGQENEVEIHVSPTVTTTYTMVGHGDLGDRLCDATPLTKKVTIVPLPVPHVSLNPPFIDTDNPKMVLRDQSTYSVASSWVFNDGSEKSGKEVSHTFSDCIGYDSVKVTLTSYNELECPKVYPFSIPVNVFTAWFPQIFTPGSNDENSKFSIFTINDYQFFHIYIYNRRGELVYDSDDVNFQWDGTHNGEPCPQGAYVYTCRFRKPGTTTLSSLQGTVTLIR